MFGWFKRKSDTAASRDVIATQPPGQVFPWPRGAVLTAVDEIVLALPQALFDKDRSMGDFVFGPDDMQMNIPPDGEVFFIRLTPGMSVSLAKSCQCYIVADDHTPRRIKVAKPAGMA